MSQYTKTANQRPCSVGFDPQTQPIVEQQASRLLVAQTLELDFIQHAFVRPVDWQVEPLFAASFPASPSSDVALRHAAVFMPLVQRPSGVHVIFTRRADHLHDHAGQISFPGGRIEPTDSGDVAAALRETHEEIGVSPDYVQLFGTHPGLVTTTDFMMTPVIGALKPGFVVVPDPGEVAEVFEVPLSVLMDPRLHRLHQAPTPAGGERFYFSIRWESHFIWGATAVVLRNFYRFLAAAQQGDE